MSAVVSFSCGEAWFTNSYSWHTILEHGVTRPQADGPDPVDVNVSVIGADFARMSDADATVVASWLVETVNAVQASDDRWESEDSCRHLAEFVSGLTDERRRRGSAA